MSDTMRAAALFLINTLFNLYLFILIIRLILVWVRTDYFNPVTQFIVKLTDFIIKPLRRVIPNIKSLETATLTLVFVLEMIKYFFLTWMSIGYPAWAGLPVLAIADILALIIQTFTYAIIVQAILSFVQPMSPIMYILARFTSPIMQPLERVIPLVGGINITPIPALLILQLLNIILVSPLMAMGQSLAFY